MLSGTYPGVVVTGYPCFRYVRIRKSRRWGVAGLSGLCLDSYARVNSDTDPKRQSKPFTARLVNDLGPLLQLIDPYRGLRW